jgi:3-oxoacyl-[acyl-carrier-protein] synthase-3
MSVRKAALKAIRTYLPSRKLTNEDLAREFGDWDVAKIYDKTGISVRSIAAPEQCASDLGVAAAELLFADGGIAREQIDFLLFCTQSPDHFLPASACIMQTRLGLPTSCGAIDFNQGCSGFVYGLALAKGLIESGTTENVLLITAETYSKYIHPRDRSVRTLFGDGAAAAWIGAVESDEERIGPFVLGTDGRGAHQLIVPAGATRMPATAETAVEQQDASGNTRSARNLYMNGPEIFTFTLREVPSLVERLLSRAGLLLEDVDFYVFHQANRFMLEQLRRKLRIPPEKFCINLENYGNTVSATIPMALDLAMERGQIATGAAVMVVGFGVGYSWAAALLKFN